MPPLLWLVTTIALIAVALVSNRAGSQGTCTSTWATFCTGAVSAANSARHSLNSRPRLAQIVKQQVDDRFLIHTEPEQAAVRMGGRERGVMDRGPTSAGQDEQVAAAKTAGRGSGAAGRVPPVFTWTCT